ncbi:MAG: hypothetical protein P4L57_06920 [Rhizomicrobium sp.]|nr:hypothetical protein [Rhizomicrobium sp.]
MRAVMTFGAAVIFMVCANAGDGWKPKPLTGEFMLYSGGLGDSGTPTKSNAKINFRIYGDAARQMFENMSAKSQKPNICAGYGNVMRVRGNIECDKAPEGSIECFIGIDLKSGKTVYGVIC